LIGFLDFFAVSFRFGMALDFRARLARLGLNSSSAANSSTPISDPVAATLTALQRR